MGCTLDDACLIRKRGGCKRATIRKATEGRTKTKVFPLVKEKVIFLETPVKRLDNMTKRYLALGNASEDALVENTLSERDITPHRWETPTRSR